VLGLTVTRAVKWASSTQSVSTQWASSYKWPEWVGPLDLWAKKIEPNPISDGLHGPMGQPNLYFKMYYFVFFFEKKIDAMNNKATYHFFLIEKYCINYYTSNKSHSFVNLVKYYIILLLNQHPSG